MSGLSIEIRKRSYLVSGVCLSMHWKFLVLKQHFFKLGFKVPIHIVPLLRYLAKTIPWWTAFGKGRSLQITWIVTRSTRVPRRGRSISKC